MQGRKFKKKFFSGQWLREGVRLNCLATPVIIMRPSAGKHTSRITLDNWPAVKRYG